MGSLRTLTVLVTLSAWGATMLGAPPDEPASSDAVVTRADPPAHPSKYVEAGIYCLEQRQDLELAAQYFQAADDYRSMLSPEEQATLDSYRARLVPTSESPLPEPTAVIEPEPAPAPTAPEVVVDEPAPVDPFTRNADDSRPTSSPEPSTLVSPPVERMVPAAGFGPEASVRVLPAQGDKQAGRWLLRQARDFIGQGRFDEAGQKVAEARALQVRWGLFDDTPDKVEAALLKANGAPAVATASAPGDPQRARVQIKMAREALSAGQIDQAEAMAREIAGWNLHYGLLEDTPDKLLAAVHAVRRRDLARNSSASGAIQDLYEVAVAEARADLAAGRLDDAENKARKALAMNVAPSLTADRAESVLHDVAMIRDGGQKPMTESAGAEAERDANLLLAQGQQEAAAAKFLEAERLRNAEQMQLMASAPTDPALTQVGDGQGNLSEEPAPILVEPDTAPLATIEEPTPAPMPIEAPVAVLEAPEPQPEPESMPAVVSPTPMLTLNPVLDGPMNQGEALLSRAQALMTTGNFPAARQTAEQARTGGYGVEDQANDLIAQINLASQAGSLNLYEAALDALRKGDNPRARALLMEVASSDLQDESLAQKVQDLLARIPGDTPGRATLEAFDDADAVKAQKLNVEVGTKVAEARRLLETDPDQAITLLEETMTAVEAAGLKPTAARTLVRRVEVAIELAKKEKAEFDVKMKDRAYRAEIEAKKLRILEADKAKMEQLSTLMDEAIEAESQGDFTTAEQKARMAAEIDPNNVAAVALATKSRWQRRYERDVRTMRDKDETAVEAFQLVDESSIVPNDVQRGAIGFPKDFADLTRDRRELAERLAYQKDPREVETETKLSELITLDMMGDQPLSDVVEFLASYHGLNMVLDPKALADEGLTPTSPVSPIKAKDIPMKTALKLILNPLRLTYRIEGNVVLITSPEATLSQTVTRAYAVGDLVISPHGRGNTPNPVPGISGISLGQPQNNANPYEGLDAAMRGQTQFGAPNQGSQPGDATTFTGNRQLSREDFEPLVQLVKASIAPGTWQESPDQSMYDSGLGLGGGLGGEDALGAGTEQAIGSITPFFLNISLIIRHISEVHDEIVDLLRQLRRLQDLQISVEVRFITVSDSFFEEIGVDFDFAIQSDVVGKKSSFAIPNNAAGPNFYDPTGGGGGGAGAAVAPYLINAERDHAYGSRQPLVVGTNAPTNSLLQPSFSPNLMIPFLQDSISAITPFNALASNTGATFGLAFLSDLEVYFFLRAVQGDTRSNLVQAPKVTTFNGAPASIFSTTQINYVAQLQPVVGAGAVAFQPQIGTFQDGVQLFVTPVVSADRRYVRMTMSPVFQGLNGFDTFTIPAAVGGGGLGGGATSINGQVQLPRFSFNQVSTTVTVPDGGTVLLGGVKRLREERTEFGVPILSKTPWINRLFRNIGVGRTTESLMLMVTPRIIILEEEEEKLGIPAVQNVTF